MKKVLIIPSWYPTSDSPILGTFFRGQASLLTDIYEILILCGSNKRDIPKWKKVWNTINYIIFKKVTIRYKEDFFLSPPPIFGFEYECGLNFTKKTNHQITLYSYIKAFEKVKKDWTPDLIHAHCVDMGGSSAYNLFLKFNIPYIITEHQPLIISSRRYFRKSVVSAFESAEMVLVPSTYLSRLLLLQGLNVQPIVVGNLVDETKFYINPSVNKTIFNILTVTYPDPVKDPETFFKALQYLKKIGVDNINATVIGNSFWSENDDSLMEMGQKYDVMDVCHFVKHVDPDFMVNYYHDCDVYVSTSISETFGVAACEAMFCGKPVISTANGGIEEFLNDENGIKVGLRDFVGIAQAVRQIMGSIKIFDSSNIRNTVVRRYGKEAFRKNLLEAYNSVLEK